MNTVGIHVPASKNTLIKTKQEATPITPFNSQLNLVHFLNGFLLQNPRWVYSSGLSSCVGSEPWSEKQEGVSHSPLPGQLPSGLHFFHRHHQTAQQKWENTLPAKNCSPPWQHHPPGPSVCFLRSLPVASPLPPASWEEESKTNPAHFLSHKLSSLTACISFNDETVRNGAAGESLQLYKATGNTPTAPAHLITSSTDGHLEWRTAKRSTEMPRALERRDLSEGHNEQGHQATLWRATVWAAPAERSCLQVVHSSQAKQIWPRPYILETGHWNLDLVSWVNTQWILQVWSCTKRLKVRHWGCSLAWVPEGTV